MSPRHVTPYKRGRTWWARVPRIGQAEGRQLLAVQRSLGVTDADEAREVCRFLEWLRGRGARNAYLLDQMASGKAPVLDAYRAYVENRLDAFEQRLREGIADPDVEPFVTTWQREMERRKRPNEKTRRKYVMQVRSFLPQGVPCPRSAFTRQRIRAWLSDLPVAQPNRYRAALSSFAQYLVFEDILADNPVRHVPMARESEPRTVHLSPADADRLAAALEQPHRALHGLMMATGMELGAALSLTRGDVSADGVYARGTKREHRKRVCTVYWRWEPLWAAHVAPFLGEAHSLPAAKIFAHVTPWGAYRAMKAALATRALKDLPQDYRVHDHRHTWAVQAIRDGLALQTVAHQLGHRDSVMTLRVYGKFRPTAADFGAKPPTAEAPRGIQEQA